MLDKWCSIKNELQVTEVATGNLCAAFGMGDERVDRAEEVGQLSALPDLLTH